MIYSELRSIQIVFYAILCQQLILINYSLSNQHYGFFCVVKKRFNAFIVFIFQHFFRFCFFLFLSKDIVHARHYIHYA